MGEWIAIPGTVHAGSPAAPSDNPADPGCASTRRLAFSGIARSGNQIVLAATGGHGDYSGNQVTAIDLSQDSPVWALLQTGSAATDVVQDAAYYLDGLPSARHTYGSVHFSTTRNRLMLHYSRFVYGSGVSFLASNGFNLGSNRWDPAGTWSDAAGMALTRDEHDNVWAVGGYFYLSKWDPISDRWFQTGRFAKALYGAMAHDSKRDLLFQFGWGDNQGGGSGVSAFVYDIGGTTQTVIAIQPSAALTQFQIDAPANATMVYDFSGDRFLFWDGLSGRLYQVTPNAGTTWSLSIFAATGTTPPVASYNFGRMTYVPALRGIVVMPSGHQPLYFMRLA